MNLADKEKAIRKLAKRYGFRLVPDNMGTHWKFETLDRDTACMYQYPPSIHDMKYMSLEYWITAVKEASAKVVRHGFNTQNRKAWEARNPDKKWGRRVSCKN